MATRRNDITDDEGRGGGGSTSSVPASSDSAHNSASEIIEAPQPPVRDKLDPHDFASGGGSGGGEAFSRKKTK